MALTSHIEVNDPFWSYKPNTGDISDAGWAFLKEYLREDDLPVGVLDSQLDVHLCESPIIGAFGGNQGGKTTLEVIEALIFATGYLPLRLRKIYPKSKLPDIQGRGRRQREITVDSKLLRSNLIPAFRQWVPRDCLKGGSWEKSYKAEDDVLTLYRDGKPFSTTQFKTNQQEVSSFQGVPLDRLGCDEEPGYEIYKENLLRFTTAKRLNVLFSMTPTNGMSWVHSKILLRRDGKKISCFQIPSITNPRANLDILREILGGLPSYEERKMRLLGAFVSLTGLIYGALFKLRIHVVPPFEIDRKDFIVYRGLDPHTSKPSVWVEVAVDREGNEYVCGAEELAGDTQEVKTRMRERAEEFNYRLGWTNSDCSANTINRLLNNRNIHNELKMGRDAIPGLMLSEKYAGSIMAGVDDIKKKLRLNEITRRPGLVIMDKPELQPLIESMQTIERERFNNEEKMGVKDKVREGPHDYHAALRYAHQKRMNWMSPPSPAAEYVPVNAVVNY